MILNPQSNRQPIGWPLLPVPDEKGELAFPSLEESVRQNLQVILSTRPGEQLMNPNYGAGLSDFLGQPDTLTTRSRIHDRIKAGIKKWERRILLDRVDVTNTPDRPGQIAIQISYRIRLTGDPQSLNANLQLQS